MNIRNFTMEHYYSKKQSSLLGIKKIRQDINGKEFFFYTSSGVFSKNKVDSGTLLLAENMAVGRNSDVLDIGCGIGVLGIAAAKLFGSKAVMSDINERAAMLANMNAKLNNVTTEVCCGKLYEPVKKNDFDVVLSNPPQNAGKELCFEMIGQSIAHLKNKGSLQIVVRRNKGGRSLSKKMKEVFGNVEVMAKKAGYWVYRGVK